MDDMRPQKLKKALIWIFSLTLAVFLLPKAMPLLLALCLAASLQGVIDRVTVRLSIGRGTVSAIVCLLTLLLLFAGAFLIIWRGGTAMSGLIKKLPGLISPLSELIDEKIYEITVASPPELGGRISKILDSASAALKTVPEKAATGLWDVISAMISNAPRILLGLVTFCIGLFFISAGYPEIRGFFLRQIPEPHRKKAAEIKACVTESLFGWLKAQLIMCAITFCELTAAFFMLRINGAVIAAALTAIVDMLPVFGTGAVLLPWAAVKLASGEIVLGAALLCVYAVVTVVRSVTEPKLMGRDSGASPAAMLCAMYIGSRTMGVGGMLLFPILLMVLTRLVSSGAVNLWQTP